MQDDEKLIEEIKEEPHGLTFVQALREVASGHPQFVSREQYLARIQTCRACPSRAPINVCNTCKCVIPLKARFHHSKCPEGKW
jgi:hypothetical protein